jgi:uncharacterized protein (DUF2141 family)
MAIHQSAQSARILLMAALASLGLATAAEANASSLTVNISGLKKPQGQVCLSLFANGQGFPTQGSSGAQARCVKAAGALQVTFSNLAPGSYAVAVLHDANGDNQMNRNGLGVPTEGFGFSRNPSILKGLPRFGDAAVAVNGATTTQIQLTYLLGG